MQVQVHYFQTVHIALAMKKLFDATVAAKFKVQIYTRYTLEVMQLVDDHGKSFSWSSQSVTWKKKEVLWYSYSQHALYFRRLKRNRAVVL